MKRRRKRFVCKVTNEEVWAWPLEPVPDEFGNRYFKVYVDGRHSSSDYRVIIMEVKGDG